MLTACATPPREAVGESLDEGTGTTVTVIAAPIELLATEARSRGADPFAFLAPFETNRAGARARFLWASVPGEGIEGTPEIFADGARLSLESRTLDLAALGLSKPPYVSPAPWNAQFLYALDAEALAVLARSQQLALVVKFPETGALRFASSAPPGPVLTDFAARTAD
jgi:hypothetical protein